MLLRIHHETHYRYEPGVQASEHVLCLHLLDTPQQQVIAQDLQVLPANHRHSRVEDEFGNLRTHLSIQAWHTDFSAIATALVRTHTGTAQVPTTTLQDALAAVQRNGRLAPFVQPSLQTVHDERLRAYALEVMAQAPSLVAGCVALMQRMHLEFVYSPFSTTIYTPVLEVFEQRRGVCQDFAHLMLSALRSVGLAARYVSGYLLTRPPPGQVKLIGADASHAWVSVYIPTSLHGRKGYWYDFCPTNGRWGWGSPGEDFITLAYGRDYHDVSPVRGVLVGAGSQAMQVRVDVRDEDASAPPPN